jgi:YD repeat-containing protein
MPTLIEADANSGNDYAYSYDAAGNHTGVWVNGTRVLTLTHDAANQVDGWDYDDAGNLLNDGTSTYGYAALNRLTQQGGTANVYNGDGVLVQSGATHYTQDLAAPLSQIVQTIDGGTTTEHLYGHIRSPRSRARAVDASGSRSRCAPYRLTSTNWHRGGRRLGCALRGGRPGFRALTTQPAPLVHHAGVARQGWATTGAGGRASGQPIDDHVVDEVNR